MNNNDTSYHPHIKTAVSSFRFERTSLRKRLDKYQEQHSKTLRDIAQNQKELTRSLSSESEQSADKHKLIQRRRACSSYGTEHRNSFAVAECDVQHSVSDSTVMFSKYDSKNELPLSYPVKTQTNDKLTASSFFPSKPTSARFFTSRSCSSDRSNSVAESKPTHDNSKKVLKRQARIEKSQERDVQRSLLEQTKNMIIADQESSLRSSKVNKDALKDQNHDKHKMNLTEKSQQTTDKRSVNSLHQYEVKTTEQNDKEKSFFNLFKNEKPLPSVTEQNANSSRQTKPRNNNSIKSVNDISRTLLEPASVIIKQRLRPTKSLSPIFSTTNAISNKARRKTFAGVTEHQGCYSENPLVRKQVNDETKKANPNDQYLKRCHRNAWSEIDDNYMEKRLSTPKGETYTPSLKLSLRKQSDVKIHLSNNKEEETVFNSIEMKEKLMEKCYEPPTNETINYGREENCSAIENHNKEPIPREEQRNETILQSEVKDHVMHTTSATNQISEENLDTECHSLNNKDTPRHPSGNGCEGNSDSRGIKALLSVLEPQSKGWRKLRAIPMKRLQEISEVRETERKLPVLQDFKVRDTRLPDRPGLMSFRQVVLAAIKRNEEQSKKKKPKGETLISKERLNEIQQPTESFLRQTIDKKMMYYTTHAPRPPTEERSKRGPEFHTVARGIQGFQTLNSVVNANRLSRAERIRRKSALPYTRTQEMIANRQKTISEMMEEVKDSRYLRNKEYVT